MEFSATDLGGNHQGDQPGQFLDKVDFPVMMHDRFSGPDVQKIVQLLFLDVSTPVETSQAQFSDFKLSMPRVEVPLIQFIAGVCAHAVRQQRQVRTVQTVQLGLCSSL